jgi:hypothetical protein
MTLPFLINSLFLITSVALSFLWVSHPDLSLYTLQLIAVFILLFFFLNKLKKPQLINSLILASIFTMVVMLLVLSTGGLQSPLFFLIYFLLFGLSLTLEPMATMVLSLILTLFFISQNPLGSPELFIPLFSLILITPLSLIFGQQYLKNLKYKGRIKILKKQGQEMSEDISQEETNALLFLSLDFKHRLHIIIDSVSQALERPSLTPSQQQLLQKALMSGKKLLKAGKKLEQKIDEQTD